MPVHHCRVEADVQVPPRPVERPKGRKDLDSDGCGWKPRAPTSSTDPVGGGTLLWWGQKSWLLTWPCLTHRRALGRGPGSPRDLVARVGWQQFSVDWLEEAGIALSALSCWAVLSLVHQPERPGFAGYFLSAFIGVSELLASSAPSVG